MRFLTLLSIAVLLGAVDKLQSSKTVVCASGPPEGASDMLSELQKKMAAKRKQLDEQAPEKFDPSKVAGAKNKEGNERPPPKKLDISNEKFVKDAEDDKKSAAKKTADDKTTEDNKVADNKTVKSADNKGPKPADNKAVKTGDNKAAKPAVKKATDQEPPAEGDTQVTANITPKNTSTGTKTVKDTKSSTKAAKPNNPDAADNDEEDKEDEDEEVELTGEDTTDSKKKKGKKALKDGSGTEGGVEEKPAEGGMSTGAIVGICCAVGAVVIGAVVGGVVVMRGKKAVSSAPVA